MPRSKRKQSGTDVYHVVSRGNNQNHILQKNNDKKYFRSIMQRRAEKFGVKVYAYCIMSNHVHILLKSDFKNLSLFMQEVNSIYAIYHNYKYGKSGHVFQGLTQRAEEELPEGQADHARREAQLHHRRRGAEIARHRGERRQIHVRDEGTECREQPQQDEKKGFGIFVVHLFFFPVQKYVAYSAFVSSDAAGCSSFSELHLCKPEPGTRMRCCRAACVGLECFADGSGGFHAGASFLGVRARKCSLWGRGVLQGGFSCAAPDLVARGR